MKKTRKLLIAMIAVLLAVLIAVGGVVIWKNNHVKSVDVFPVMSVYETYWGDTTTLDGTVTTGKVQNVPLRESLVQSINVAVGDTVSEGDVLMVYDTTSFDLTLQMDRAEIALLESNIAIEKNNLSKYKGLRPSEDMPQPTEEIIDHGELSTRDAITAADMTGGEMTFLCDGDTVVTADFLRALRDAGAVAELQMYEGTTLYGSWFIDGAALPATRVEYMPYVDETGAETGYYIPTEVEVLEEDWYLNQSVSFNGVGVDLNLEQPGYGRFISCTPEEYEQFESVWHENYVPDDSENYMYSKAELAQLIQQTEAEIASLQLDLRAAELDYQQDLLVSETGEIKASISGTVTEVKDPAELATGEALITVKGTENYTVTAYIGEMNLANLSIGDSLSIYAYESGTQTTATITEIETTPASGRYGWGNENPNNSYYPIIATVDDPSVEMMIGEWCEVTVMSAEEEEGGIYIPLMYVRSDEQGSYVMAADENDQLKKQYIKTGKTLWGYSIEIKGGLTLEDRIAFPYGKTVKEGAPVNDLEYPEFW